MKYSRLGGEMFPPQPRLLAVELAESGKVQIVSGWLQASLEQEERGDQVWVAADDAELAAEFLPLVTPPPSGAGGCGRNRAES